MSETDRPTLRPPAVPLVVCDPYLSVWSFHETLTERWSQHWTGAQQPLCGMARIDGEVYRFLGAFPRRIGVEEVPTLEQKSLEVLPTRTLATFEGAGVRLELTFTTPLLPADLDVMARPVTYIDMAIQSVDGGEHTVEFYLDVAANWAVNTHEQHVVWGRHRLDEREVLWVGSRDQATLEKAGDLLRIDWGYLYLSSPNGEARGSIGTDMALRGAFARSGQLPTRDDPDMPREAGGLRPPMTVLGWAFQLGKVGGEAVERQLLVAYDDRFSIEHMHQKLRPYWRRTLKDALELVETSLTEYEDLRERCEAFDAELLADLQAVGGAAYANLCTLAFRQCVAAHKLVLGAKGEPLFFSKENLSNGCIGTVDLTYPSSPFFLLFNPDLLKGQLVPVLDYAASPRWPFPYAPHDLGRYPKANGQVYGGGETSEIDQMPVEECGNMLILAGALAKVSGVDWLAPYWDLLESWADYLRDTELDLGEQLCTDDFAGHLAQNANLAVKAILGIAAYAALCEQAGRDGSRYRRKAERMAEDWLERADNGDHTRLSFDAPDTWSQKYNLVWDELLGLTIFPKELAQKEVVYYLTKIKRYGLPLDSRAAYTKLDWTLWSASLAETRADFDAFINPVHAWLNESESRVPLSDWYFTDTGLIKGFRARSVVGGVYIKLLKDKALWEKWRTRAQASEPSPTPQTDPISV